MTNNIHLRLTNVTEGEVFTWWIYTCLLTQTPTSARTFAIAVRDDTSFEQLCRVLMYNYSVTHVLLQDALFVAVPEKSLLGLDRIAGDNFLPWKKT